MSIYSSHTLIYYYIEKENEKKNEEFKMTTIKIVIKLKN